MPRHRGRQAHLDRERARRFVETARELETEESPEALERVLNALNKTATENRRTKPESETTE